MTLRISTDPVDVDFDLVHRWLRNTYWSPGIRAEVLRRALQNSLTYAAMSESQQVGFARVVTDQATFAWLCDVFVDESFRGRGIATSLVKTVLGDERLQTVRRVCLATRDAHTVYVPLGFAPVPEGRWLEMLPPRLNWSAEPP